MTKYILRRLLILIPVMLGVIFVVFLMMYLTPADAAVLALGDNATAESLEALREQLGLNRPFLVQYFDYVWGIVTRFDFGRSFTNNRPVMDIILPRLQNTMVLSVVSAGLAVVVGIFLGVVAAVKQNSLFDNASMVAALAGVSMPSFWQGLLLMLLFSLRLKWLPVSGFTTLAHVILPALTLSTGSMAIIARMTRSSMLEVIQQDYINFAKSKGQRPMRVIIGHALRNALIPIVTTVALQFGNMLGGSVIIESVFSIPGVGKLMADSIRGMNYPVVQAGVLIIALLYSISNVLADVLYAVVDPRVKSTLKQEL